MRAAAAIVLLIAACGGSPTASTTTREPTLRTWLESPTSAGGVLVVQLEVPTDVEVLVPAPRVPSLSLQPTEAARSEAVGGMVVVTQRYGYAGPPGHYLIPALTAAWQGPDGETAVSSAPIWFDLGVAPPRQGGLVDLAEPEPVWTFPWGFALVATAITGLLGGGLYFAFRPAPVITAAGRTGPSPDVVALRAWARVRKDPLRNDFAKALALSRIFREYTEAVIRFPATAWTTSEIMTHLEAMSYLPAGNLPRAKRLLRATDRVKYADESARNDLFDDLDADLRGFIESTRPRQMDTKGIAP